MKYIIHITKSIFVLFLTLFPLKLSVDQHYKYSNLSNMAPTPALWALFRCTCNPVANNIPSFTAIERCENDAMRSSFHPERDRRNHDKTFHTVRGN